MYLKKKTQTKNSKPVNTLHKFYDQKVASSYHHKIFRYKTIINYPRKDTNYSIAYLSLTKRKKKKICIQNLIIGNKNSIILLKQEFSLKVKNIVNMKIKS